MGREKGGIVFSDHLKSDKLGKESKRGAAEGIRLTHFTICCTHTWKETGVEDGYCCM